ncbi:hypothetical protein [Caloramator sp. Dgby_cultured_2]|uniref:hypothetical protein n=1 Tax=Caloramator sp. Dgby_cultured_2 TaxID=3029174 RepID=UPI00237DBB32|nr:hypothetical protein [Caloramator sp. Dgby_cultured_2]WDU82299.1 hypothetical protein PWK10_11410 [Caloramator sp. Dgby_cultured_2]
MKNDFWINEVWRLYSEGYSVEQAIKIVKGMMKQRGQTIEDDNKGKVKNDTGIIQ